jgi:prephenate dehydrogenase
MVGFVSLLGAEPYFLDPIEHDGLVTAVDQLPTLISTALLNTLSDQGSWRELRKLAGGRFEQLTSGATGDPDGLKDNLMTSRDNLTHWLDAYINQLYELRHLLADSDASEETLVENLDKAIVERQNWLTDYQQGRFVDPERVSPDIKKPGFMKQLLGIGH